MYKISALSLPQGARKESKRKTRNTQHTQKGKISKVVFLVRRIFRATLEKRKPTQVVFKLSFQYIGIIGFALYLTSA